MTVWHPTSYLFSFSVLKISFYMAFNCISRLISLLDNSISRASSKIFVSLCLWYSVAFSYCFLSFVVSKRSVLFILSSTYSLSSIYLFNYSFSSMAMPRCLSDSFLWVCFILTSCCMTTFASNILTLYSSTYFFSILISCICSLHFFFMLKFSSFEVLISYYS